MKIDEKMLLEIKKEAIENFVPILRDDTMKVIEEKLDKLRPKKVLEIGTAVGYSALTFLKHLDDDAIIDTIERNEKRYNKAVENVKKLGANKNINIIYSDAIDAMQKMDKDSFYDFIFIDAAKGQYLKFFSHARRLIKNGGVIIADNVLFHGMVNSDYNEHRNRTAVTRLRQFISDITNDENLKTNILDIDDGLAIIEVKK